MSASRIRRPNESQESLERMREEGMLGSGRDGRYKVFDRSIRYR